MVGCKIGNGFIVYIVVVAFIVSLSLSLPVLIAVTFVTCHCSFR